MSNKNLKEILTSTWNGGINDIVAENNGDNFRSLNQKGPFFTKNPNMALEKIIQQLTPDEKTILNINYATGDNVIDFQWNGAPMIATVYQIRTTYSSISEDTTVNTTVTDFGYSSGVTISTDIFGNQYIDNFFYDNGQHIHKDINVERYINDTVFGFLVGQIVNLNEKSNSTGKYQDNLNIQNLNDSVNFVVSQLKDIANQIRNTVQNNTQTQGNYTGDNSTEFIGNMILPSLIQFFNDRQLDTSKELGTNVNNSTIKVLQEYVPLDNDTRRIYFYNINNIGIGQLVSQQGEQIVTDFVNTIGTDTIADIIQKCK